MTSSRTHNSIVAAVATASVALAGAAAAQSAYQSDGGITVYGRISPNDDHPALSRLVSFRDLDLSSDAGVRTLKWRVSEAANSMCEQLGVGSRAEQNTAVLPSCQDAARDSASIQISDAVKAARDGRYYARR